MGAGSFGAGIGPAGSDPVPDPTARPTIVLPQAPEFDPFDKVYPYTPDVLVASEDPVWQRVALAVGVRRGSLRSSPTVGIPLDGMRNATDRTAQKQCEDAAAIALADLVDAGDVVIVRVVAVLPWAGKFFIDVQSLREPGQPQKRFIPPAA